jgi:methionyl-tRNA formyltransferase
MAMDEGLDTGDMLLSRAVPITPDTTAQMLHDQLSQLGAELIVPAIAGLADGALTGSPQPTEGVTYAKKLERDEGRLDFTRPAVDLERLVRAFDPWPGAFFDHDDTRIKVLAAEVFDLGAITNLPGTVLDPELTIACADGALRPTRVQRPGKGPMDVHAFLRGFQIPPGTVLGA